MTNPWARLAETSTPEEIKNLILAGHRNGRPFNPTPLRLLESDKIDTILDFGCGFGRNFPTLCDLSDNVYGYDLPEMLTAYKKTKPEITAKLLTWDDAFLGHRYDMTLASLVFQHFPTENELIETLQNLSKVSTYLYLVTRVYMDGERTNVLRTISKATCWELEVCNRRLWDVLSLEYPDQTHYQAVFKTRDENHLRWAADREDIQFAKDTKNGPKDYDDSGRLKQV